MRSRSVNSRSRALLLLAWAGAACRHAPPDVEARAAPPVVAPAERRAPDAGDLLGAWMTDEVRGALADVGEAILYVFAEEGRYTGAAVGRTECTPLEGRYVLEIDGEDAALLMDGELKFKATLLDGRLALTSEGSYMVLRRIPYRVRDSARDEH
jgi:hypothetical protein